MNHATRTFFQSLTHLLMTGIEAVFVLDGADKIDKIGRNPHKNVRPCDHVQGVGPGLPNTSTVRASSTRSEGDINCEQTFPHVIPLVEVIFDELGVRYRKAPAEAEAECAALERAGLVDCTFTHDGDAFVFGSRRVLAKFGKTKDQNVKVKEFSMDRLEHASTGSPPIRQQDIFLIAMMSGGDHGEGIRRCGVEIALKAARKGFGSKLKQMIIRHDGTPEELEKRLKKWRAELVEFLQSERFLAVAANVRTDFPSLEIARYYLKPVVSPELQPPQPQAPGSHQVPGPPIPITRAHSTRVERLRSFTREFFDWKNSFYAAKFVKALHGAILVERLLAYGENGEDGSFLIEAITLAKEEGAARQLRVASMPLKVVEVDISREDDVGAYRPGNAKVLGEGEQDNYKPKEQQRLWIPEWIVKVGARTAYDTWEKGQLEKTQGQKRNGPPVPPSSHAPKRRPGRPRKDAQQQSATDSQAAPTLVLRGHQGEKSEAPAPVQAKRGRGRPRKSQLPTEQGNNEQSISSPATDTPKSQRRDMAGDTSPPRPKFNLYGREVIELDSD